MASQLDSLKTLLQSTQLSSSNPRLFQFLNQLLDFLRGIEARLNARITAASSVATNATFLTATSEIATLPNSRELVAGTDITFDDTVSGIRTVNASGGSGTLQFTLLTNGDLIETELVFAGGDVIWVPVP